MKPACVASEDVCPDLIVLDVMMDRYTEGFRVSQLIRDPVRRLALRQPVGPCRSSVLTSIHRTTPHRFGPNQDALPVDAFLEKPVPNDQLLATIDSLLAQAATRR